MAYNENRYQVHGSEMNMAFIPPPSRMPLFLRLGLWAAKKFTKTELLPAQLLAWYPRAAFSSAMLEGLIAHGDQDLDARILKMVRLVVSFIAVCPFCIDMNSAGWEKLITPQELAALQGSKSLGEIPTFTHRERLAIRYARLVSSTPLSFPASFISELKQSFSEREIVILATTAAQVNYWTRLIQALGCPPEGFSGQDLYLQPPEKSPPQHA
jgi:alkylhydroperoxidase family enzyme